MAFMHANRQTERVYFGFVEKPFVTDAPNTSKNCPFAEPASKEGLHLH